MAFSFNRTYKELKLEIENENIIPEKLLIAPTRNWNFLVKTKLTIVKTFNRTYKELKRNSVLLGSYLRTF